MTDLHCHILPGIDDGAGDLEESMKLLTESIRQGVRQLVFTPHFYPERATVEEFLRDRAGAVEEIRRCGLDFRCRVGAEIMYTPVLSDMPLPELAFSGTNYILIELRTDYAPYDVEGLIRRLRKKGYLPVLAHIERYPYLDPEQLYGLVRAGALCQVNAGWVLRDSRALRQIEKWWKWDLVHFMASDCHSMQYRPPNLRKGMKALPEEIQKTFRRNAGAVFAGAELKISPQRPRKRLGRWI